MTFGAGVDMGSISPEDFEDDSEVKL